MTLIKNNRNYFFYEQICILMLFYIVKSMKRMYRKIKFVHYIRFNHIDRTLFKHFVNTLPI